MHGWGWWRMAKVGKVGEQAWKLQCICVSSLQILTSNLAFKSQSSNPPDRRLQAMQLRFGKQAYPTPSMNAYLPQWGLPWLWLHAPHGTLPSVMWQPGSIWGRMDTYIYMDESLQILFFKILLHKVSWSNLKNFILLLKINPSNEVRTHQKMLMDMWELLNRS